MIGKLIMADNIIKNSRRSLPKIQVPYEPEHVRKAVDVLEAPLNTITVDPEVDKAFMGVDDIIIDEDGNDLPYKDGHIIDNNDYVNIGFPQQASDTKNDKPVEDVTSPKIGDYILMVFGKLISSGTQQEIQDKVRDIMYGDDKSFSGLEVNSEDIVVLKRMPIKIGIFIDD